MRKFIREGYNTFVIINGKKHIMLGTAYFEVVTENDFIQAFGQYVLELHEKYGDSVEIRHDTNFCEGIHHYFTVIDRATGRYLGADECGDFEFTELYHGNGTKYACLFPSGEFQHKWIPVSASQIK